jgi:uncharacterized protein
MDLIIFHQDCPDGFTAAYIAKLRYPEAKLMPRNHGLEPPYAEVEGKDVLVLDFSWRTREQNDKLAKLAKSFRILDHHRSAQQVLEGADYAIFDMERSGAGLAWDYLFGKEKHSLIYTHVWHYAQPRPWYIDYVEDRDLWRFKMPESEAVNAYIMTFQYDMKSWDEMVKTDLRDAITKGKAVLLQINKYVREVVKQVQDGKIAVGDKTYTVGVVNAPYMNISEIGHALAHRWDIGLGWFERGDNIIQFSLRSVGDKDVSVVAQQYGGGGHKNTAGFQLPLAEGRRVIDQILGR